MAHLLQGAVDDDIPLQCGAGLFGNSTLPATQSAKYAADHARLGLYAHPPALPSRNASPPATTASQGIANHVHAAEHRFSALEAMGRRNGLPKASSASEALVTARALRRPLALNGTGVRRERLFRALSALMPWVLPR